MRRIVLAELIGTQLCFARKIQSHLLGLEINKFGVDSYIIKVRRMTWSGRFLTKTTAPVIPRNVEIDCHSHLLWRHQISTPTYTTKDESHLQRYAVECW